MNVMFNNTSLDVADTYRMVKSHPDWIVTNPKEGFYQYIKRANYIPSQLSRGCCGIFKEGEGINYFKSIKADKLIQFMGVRNSESRKRADREFINHNPKWTNPNWNSCLPIRKWSDLYVWLYVFVNNLELNPRYKKGYDRVGCAIACPYQRPLKWILDEYWYPNLYNRWHKILNDDFLNNKRWTCMNCTLEEYHTCWNNSLLREEPTEEVIQEMCDYTGMEREVAEKYFNKTCCECGSNVRNREVLGMNYKFLGTNSDVVYCKKCLKKKLGLDTKQWKEQVATFTEQGCTLF